MNVRVKYLLYSLIPLALILLSLETAFRFLDLGAPFTATLEMWGAPMEILEDDPFTVKRPRPNLSLGSITLNSRGQRDDELRSDADLKILCLGDSVTFGWGVHDPGNTYAGQLEKMLARRLSSQGKTVEVYNAGVPSYRLFQGFQLYLHYLAGLADWDLVIISFAWNEPKEYDTESEYAQRNSPTENPFIKPIRRTAENLRTYNYLQSFWISKVLNSEENRKKVANDRYGAMLRDFIRSVKKRHSQVILLATQVRQEEKGDSLSEEIARLNAIEHQLADQEQAIYVDTDELFVLKRSGWYDYVHFDETGHLLSAESLYGVIVNKLGL